MQKREDFGATVAKLAHAQSCMDAMEFATEMFSGQERNVHEVVL